MSWDLGRFFWLLSANTLQDMEVRTVSHRRAENLLFDPNSKGMIPCSASSGPGLLDQTSSALSSIVEFNTNIFSRTGLLNSSIVI
jgi:hypothetical protein